MGNAPGRQRPALGHCMLQACGVDHGRQRVAGVTGGIGGKGGTPAGRRGVAGRTERWAAISLLSERNCCL